MNSTVPGRLGRCNSTWRKPISRIGCKNSDQNKTASIRSNEERPPCSSRSRVQPPPETNSIEEIQHASQYKAHNLNPSPLTKRKEAQQIEPLVETRASVVLDQDDK